MLFLIKYLILTWCGIYSFQKLSNCKTTYKQTIIWLPITFFTSLLSYYLRLLIPPLNLLSIFITIFLFTLVNCQKNFNLSIVISVISFCLSLIFYSLAWIITSPIAYLLFTFEINPNILNILTAIIIGIIHFFLIYFFFNIKRFKNGITAFENKLSNDLSTFLSIITLFSATIFYKNDTDYLIDSIIIFILSICGLLIYFYWKSNFTNTYQRINTNKKLDVLENENLMLLHNYSELTEHNKALSKIIHRDNKLIPAMEMAIEEILSCQSPDEQKKKAEALLPQLRAMSAERSGIVTEYETTNKKLPSTGIFSVDSSLKYLLKKANDKNITFDLSVTAEISNITNSIINEDDLNTLILDLGENAIIATSDMEHQNVLVVMGYENNSFCISIYDSANHFDPKVISKLGIKRITTHKNTGGSGIGMMTTFELLQKYQASFILDETINSDKFNKKVSVHFDEKNEYRIQTNRAEIISMAKKRTDLIIN